MQRYISDSKNLLSLVFPILFSGFRIPDSVPVSGSGSRFRIPGFSVAHLLRDCFLRNITSTQEGIHPLL